MTRLNFLSLWTDESRAGQEDNANVSNGLPPVETDAPSEPVQQFVPPTRESIMADRARAAAAAPRRVVPLIEVIANDRLGGKGASSLLRNTVLY